MRRTGKIILWAAFCGIISFFSCVKEFGYTAPDQWSPDYSFPIGRSSLALNTMSGVDTALLLINPLTGFPFWAEEIQVPLDQTFPFNFHGILNDETERILFRLNAWNGFPTAVKGQVYFLDGADNVLDSVFSSPLSLEPGVIVNGGEEVSVSFESNDAILDRTLLENIRTVEKVWVKGAIQNLALDTALIDYYSSYTLEIQVGVQIKFNFVSDNLSN